jgi:transcriptional regulator with XRE-family HTH domain
MKLKIKEYREELGITQKELADSINNLQRNVSNWEKGTAEPDCQTIMRLADFFNISTDELFGRNVRAQSSKQVVTINEKILQAVELLTESQKYALLQFLKEMIS